MMKAWIMVIIFDGYTHIYNGVFPNEKDCKDFGDATVLGADANGMAVHYTCSEIVLPTGWYLTYRID